MVDAQVLRSALEDASWRYPIVLGLASVPYTLYAGWPSLSEIGPPVAVVGFAAAFLFYGRGEVESFTIGGRAGLVAQLPVVVWIPQFVWVGARMDGPVWFRATAVGMVFAAIPVAIFLGYVGAGLFGMVGGWLASRTTTRRPAIPAPWGDDQPR